MTVEEFLTELPIPDENIVFRQASSGYLIHPPGNKQCRYPNESHFMPDEDGLSVSWNQHITVEGLYHLIGLTYKTKKTEYKNPKEFKVFSFPVAFLRQLDGLQVNHTPWLRGNPAPVGDPNNYAHASIRFSDEDQEIRVKLSDYCREYNEQSLQNVNFDDVLTELEVLRAQLNTSIYHNI